MTSSIRRNNPPASVSILSQAGKFASPRGVQKEIKHARGFAFRVARRKQNSEASYARSVRDYACGHDHRTCDDSADSDASDNGPTDRCVGIDPEDRNTKAGASFFRTAARPEVHANRPPHTDGAGI